MAKPRSRPQLSLQSAHLYDDGAGIPAEHWCRRFHREVYSAFRDTSFEKLYKEGGRHPIPPSFLASITLLQYMFKASDRVAVENTIMRRDWRIALGITPDYKGFDASVLCTFRKRLVQHDATSLVFDQVLELLEQMGLIKHHQRVRVDATELIADVAILSRAESLMEAIRIVVHDAHQRFPGLQQLVHFRQLHERYGEEEWLGRTSSGQQKLKDLGRDARALLQLCGSLRPKGYQVLAQMLDENFIFDAEGEPQPLSVEERPKDHIVTPHEPDVRVGKKDGELWTGDKAHLLESVHEGEQGFILDVLVTPPEVNDCEVLPALALRTAARLPQVGMIIADTGYASATNSWLTDLLGIDLLSRPRESNCRTKMPIEQFDIDFVNRVAICPQGCRSTTWSLAGRSHSISFAAKDCAACSRREDCTTDPTGRSLSPSIHYPELQRERARFQQPGTAELYSQRASIEATISELVHRCGFRRSRYRGAAKRALHVLLAAAALNVRRLLRCLAAEDGTKTPSKGAFLLLFPRLAAAHRCLLAPF